MIKKIEKKELHECALCGADLDGLKIYKARSGEEFCSRYHRDKSVRMFKYFKENVKTR